MSLLRLPYHILTDIINQITTDGRVRLSDVLSLRLVNQRMNVEILDAVFERDVCNIHRQVYTGLCSKQPAGVALQRFTKGFVFRAIKNSESEDNIKNKLRDGAIILAAILNPVDEQNKTEADTSTRDLTLTTPAKNDLSAKQEATITSRTLENTDKDKSQQVPEQALSLICEAYIDFLGEKNAFESFDPVWHDTEDHLEAVNDKTAKFWALLGAAYDGRQQIVPKAIEACCEHDGSEEGLLALKTYLAAALVLIAKHGHLEAAEVLLKQPDVRLNLRFQNIRFFGKNGMEAAIESSQCEMIKFLLSHGWNLFIVPSDYTGALEAIVSKMKEGQLRTELLQTLIEGECQEWRSESIINGLFCEISRRGDLAFGEKLLTLIETQDSEHYNLHSWQWSLESDRNSGNTSDSDSDTGDDASDTSRHSANIYRKTALHFAVTQNQHRMISFLFENRSLLPTLTNTSFARASLLICTEHAIQHKHQECFANLWPHISILCPMKLFLYAALNDNVPAMTKMMDKINLAHLISSSDQFWDTDEDPDSDLTRLIDRLTEVRAPNSFLFNCYYQNPRNLKLGTYALLCTIKSLQVNAAKFLLDHDCEIGTRLQILSPTFIERTHARLFLPHHSESCAHCADAKPHLGRKLLMLSLKQYRYVDVKRMLEFGASVPENKTRFFSRQGRWRLWRWHPCILEEMDAKIIMGIQIAEWVWDEWRAEEVERRFGDMHGLMRRWKMPFVYFYTGAGAF